MFETVKAHVKARVRRWVEEDRPAGDLAGPEWDDVPRGLPAPPVQAQALRASPPPLPPSLRRAPIANPTHQAAAPAAAAQEEDWDRMIEQAKRQANARAVEDDWSQAISRAKGNR